MFRGITQNPIGIGAKGVEYAMKAISGDTSFDKNIDTGCIWADKTDIDSPEVQAALYK